MNTSLRPSSEPGAARKIAPFDRPSVKPLETLPSAELEIGDVADWPRSLAAVRSSEIRYRRLFEAARDGILILDPNTRKITDSNPFMTELLGYPREGLVGKELWEIGLLKDEAASQEAFRELREKHYIRYEDLPLQTASGKRREVEFVSNLYKEDTQDVIQCNIRDITDRKRVEKALDHARDQLTHQAAELERLVEERTAELRKTVGELQAFSYSASHDMRSPLRSMQGFAQILLDEYSGKLDERGVNFLQRIMHSAMRLDRLLQDVLTYSGIVHAHCVMGPVDLDRLMRDIIQTYPNRNNAQFQIQEKLPRVLGNESFLTQCFSNLLGNAAKFVGPGTTPRIEIGAESRESVKPAALEEAADGFIGPPRSDATTVRIWIRDNGIGIAPENHKRIFRMFERIHPAKEYEGTGIGLTIVGKAAERMGAVVGFESDLGKGSRFWIQLQKA
jgi:PAS domain S-box-containing protein